MTEHEPTPEEEAEVTRLLADAGGPVPMPESVASRLDVVLADLVAERSTSTAVEPRRRRWPQVLVAAAAVALIGYVGSVVVPRDSSTNDGGSATAGADVAPSAPESAAEDEDQGSKREQRDTASGAPQNLAGLDFLLKAESPTSAGSGRPCRLPVLAEGEHSLQVTLRDGSRAVAVVRPVNGSAARVDLYPCRRPLFPVSSSLVLAAR